MGLDYNGVKYLLYCKYVNKVEFGSVLMLGRQNLHLSKDKLSSLFDEFDITYNKEILNDIMPHKFAYADMLLKYLGASEVHSLDYSDYEESDLIHDLNEKIDINQHEKYNCVIDGGTLEHVFDVKNAFYNCMNFLKLNGYFISITPANNFMGHGFYQFSPELFYRIFDSDNGFEVLSLCLVESDSRYNSNIWYSVKDPKVVKSRITVQNFCKTYMMTCAFKNEVKNDSLFSNMLQSDYVETWNDSEVRQYNSISTQNKSLTVFFIKFIKLIIPNNIKMKVYQRLYDNKSNLSSRNKFFDVVKKIYKI